jgi:hypothetical protein
MRPLRKLFFLFILFTFLFDGCQKDPVSSNEEPLDFPDFPETPE